MIAIDLSQQQALDFGPKTIHQINFTWKLNQGQNVTENTTIFFVIEEEKGTI